MFDLFEKIINICIMEDNYENIIFGGAVGASFLAYTMLTSLPSFFEFILHIIIAFITGVAAGVGKILIDKILRKQKVREDHDNE